MIKKDFEKQETLVIGRGRVARQLARYFDQMGIGFSTWHRGLSPEELYTKAVPAHRVLMAISDNAITSFIDENQEVFREKFIVHFSGTQFDERALGFHPLAAITGELPIDFKQVTFQGITAENEFRKALPMFDNAYRQLTPDQMHLYHALCVLGANCSSLLWKNFYEQMQKIEMPKSALDQFVQNVTANVVADPEKCVTGPLVRGDHQTVNLNLAALEKFPALKNVYQAFLTNFQSKEALQ